MNQTLLILDGDGADRGSGRVPTSQLYESFLHDIFALASHLPHTRPFVVHPSTVHKALEAALADGPAVVVTADVPHVPLWRLRDAFTYLNAGINLVLGPGEQSGWYLLGLADNCQHLLPALPITNPSRTPALPDQKDVAVLPAWYRLCTPADLERLVIDLAPMPPGTAAHTRAFLGDGLQARALGS